jgi:predicted transcriptional regulator
MPQTSVNLSPENSQKLEVIASHTGKSRDELANEAVERLELPSEVSHTEDWKAASMQAAGMRKDRDDLPDFDEIRRSWDRSVWSRRFLPDRLLIDSDVLIDFLRGHPKAKSYIRLLQSCPFLSAAMVAELYAGVREGQERQQLDGLVSGFRISPYRAKSQLLPGFSSDSMPAVTELAWWARLLPPGPMPPPLIS